MARPKPRSSGSLRRSPPISLRKAFAATPFVPARSNRRRSASALPPCRSRAAVRLMRCAGASSRVSRWADWGRQKRSPGLCSSSPAMRRATSPAKPIWLTAAWHCNRARNFRLQSMHILITGAAGMIGRKLTARLIAAKALNDRPLERLTLLDVGAPRRPEGFSTHVKTMGADIADDAAARAVIADWPDVIFHLAAVVSGEAELNFEKGVRVNFDGSRALLEV